MMKVGLFSLQLKSRSEKWLTMFGLTAICSRRAPSSPFTNPISFSTHYRPDIDGLRAIAILSVVAFHAFPGLVHGGFVGVDMFFVISGFLITGIIDRQIQEEKFSVMDFYFRRVRRIFPALLIVSLTAFLMGWFLLSPHEFESLGTNLIGGAVFAQNLTLLAQTGYFDLAASKKPLLHLWSLGVEEQFYLVWPFAMMFMRRRVRTPLAITASIATTSVTLAFITSFKNPDWAFYLPFTRFWELLIGSILSFTFTKESSARGLKAARASIASSFSSEAKRIFYKKGLQEGFAILAVAALLFSIFRFKPYASFPGSASFIPTFSTALLIVTADSFVSRLLSARPVVFLGVISYPLYLWHNPLIALIA